MSEEELKLKQENDTLKAHVQLLEGIINADPVRLIAHHLRNIDTNLGYLMGVILENRAKLENEEPTPPQRDPPPVA